MVRLPTHTKKFSILKSPFKYHKAFDAFQVRTHTAVYAQCELMLSGLLCFAFLQWKTHTRLVTIKSLPAEHEPHIEHVVNELPPGVNCKVTETRPLQIPFPTKEDSGFVPPYVVARPPCRHSSACNRVIMQRNNLSLVSDVFQQTEGHTACN